VDLRALDSLVAEKVMGWTAEALGLTADDLKRVLSPPYSTDIEAAWEVMEVLSLRYEIQLSCEVDHAYTGNPMPPVSPAVLRWSCDLREHYLTMNPGHVRNAASAPLAICLMALKAFGVPLPG
jgi:hypothetical protein